MARTGQRAGHDVLTVERISGPDDPRVAPYRQMSDAERMRSSGLFVAEGRLVVRRVVEDGRYRVQSLLVNDAALRDVAPSLAGLPAGVADKRGWKLSSSRMASRETAR